MSSFCPNNHHDNNFLIKTKDKICTKVKIAFLVFEERAEVSGPIKRFKNINKLGSLLRLMGML